MKWINIEDELPEEDTTVLLWDSMFNTYMIASINFEPEKIDADISHWMPLPEPPLDTK